jgi:hypothetical protein
MSRHISLSLAATIAAVAVTACSDLGTGAALSNTVALSSAFQTIPAGFSATSNTFDASGDRGRAFFPGDFSGASIVAEHGDDDGESHDIDDDHGDHDEGELEDHHDGFGRGIGGLMMGGGLGPEFIGGIPFGRDRGHGPFGELRIPSDCSFDATSERVDCPDRTHDGLTLTMSFQLKDTGGVAQAAFDTLSTDYVNVQTSISGTKVDDDPDDDNRDDDASVQATLSHSSDRTISGLAPGSTARTINGTSVGHEEVTGTHDAVTFAATRDVSDTTTNLVIPIADGRPTIPSSGVVIRNMAVSITKDGGAPVTHTRREQITFDGTSVVQVEVTQDGTTKNCTVTLPRRQLVCE